MSPATTPERDALIVQTRERIRGLAISDGCGNDAEDIAQDVASLLSGRYRYVTDPLGIVKLANRIYFNLVHNWRRCHRRPSDELDDAMAANGPDPESIAYGQELKWLMLDEIKKLGKRCKQLLHLKLEGASTEEIAKQLDISPDAVHTAFYRCLKKLRVGWGSAK
jgi:RNA polymerase sigma factor (sigma-70 family)